MRVIKFRYVFKHKSTSQIIVKYWVLSDIEENGLPVYYGQYDLIERCLFTGLHDKNGKEIYEGDILKEGIRHGTDTGLIYKVVWFQDDTHNGWNIAKKGIRGDEIIGNIYENPDLAGVAV